MALCNNDCVINLPVPLENGCRPEVRNGGISHVLFFHCALRFEDVYDLSEWCRYLEEGWLTITKEVLGQKPKASAVRKRQSSCRSEQVIGFDYSVTFQDYNADNVEFSDYDFWNTIQQNQQLFQTAFITCDGHLYGFDPSTGTFIHNFSIEISNVIEDDYNGSSYWDGSIEWKANKEFKPIYVPGLMNVLHSGDCNSVNPYGGSNPNPPQPNCRLTLVSNTSSQDGDTIRNTFVYELPCDCDTEWAVSVLPNENYDWINITYPNRVNCNVTNRLEVVTTVNTVHPNYDPNANVNVNVNITGTTTGISTTSGTMRVFTSCVSEADAIAVVNAIIAAFSDPAWTSANLTHIDDPSMSFEQGDWWRDMLNRVNHSLFEIMGAYPNQRISINGKVFPSNTFQPGIFIASPSKGYYNFFIRICGGQTVWLGLTYRINDNTRWSVNASNYGTCIGNYSYQNYDGDTFDGICS
jgi:hypothetical protein